MALAACASTLLLAGDYEVGKTMDIEGLVITPGTYAVGTSSHCYWERVRGFSGEFDDIIANDNITWKADKEECGPWDAEWRDFLDAIRKIKACSAELAKA